MVDEKFLYVFDKASRDKLLAAGLKLIASYEKKDTYVFANELDDAKKKTFSLDDVTFFPSNKLTF